MTRMSTFPTLLACLLLLGCGKGKDKQNTPSPSPAGGAEARLIGVWSGSEKPTIKVGDKEVEAAEAVEITIEFAAAGKLAMNMGGLEVKGTWKLEKSEGDALKVHTALPFPEGGIEDSIKDDKRTTKVDIKETMQEETLTIVFENNDRIRMISPSNPKALTLQRKK